MGKLSEQCSHYRDEELSRYENYRNEKLILAENTLREEHRAMVRSQIAAAQTYIEDAVQKYNAAIRDIEQKIEDRYPETMVKRLVTAANDRLQEAVEASKTSIENCLKFLQLR
jgi:hypothetical protein